MMDLGLFARHHGIATFTSEAYEPFFKLNPAKSKSLNIPPNSSDPYDYVSTTLALPLGWINTIQYMAVLGHNFFKNEIAFRIYTRDLGGGNETYISSDLGTVNCNPLPDYGYTFANVDGYSMLKFNNIIGSSNTEVVITMRGAGGTTFNIGDISAGWTYEMPHSPDLSLKLSYQNESISTQTTKGGHSLSNSGWAEPPYWLNLPQWMTSDNTEGITNYKGMTPATRRQYDLSFSFLADTGMLNEYYPGGTGEQVGESVGQSGILTRSQTGTDPFVFTGMQDNFFSKVWMGTANGKLPFIFQPDKDVDEFAICKINADTFTMQQQAPNLYSVSMSIMEVW